MEDQRRVSWRVKKFSCTALQYRWHCKTSRYFLHFSRVVPLKMYVKMVKMASWCIDFLNLLTHMPSHRPLSCICPSKLNIDSKTVKIGYWWYWQKDPKMWLTLKNLCLKVVSLLFFISWNNGRDIHILQCQSLHPTMLFLLSSKFERRRG